VFAELLAEPGVVERVELRSTFGFMALHGGSLERGTAEIARAAAEASGASLYVVEQPEDLRWHIPSKLIDPAESDALARFLAHIDIVVSVHGYGREGHARSVLVGGSNRPLAARAGWGLRAALPTYRVIDDLDAIPPLLRGVHASNPVNRPQRSGIQLELPTQLREHDLDDREALVDVLAGLV
jgi:phage replication-related protein YjqB (UPF0714/DUF867 family)